MTNPEQGEQENFRDIGSSLKNEHENAGQKFMSEAYVRVPFANRRAASENLDAPKDSRPHMNKESAKLEKEGNVESLKVPDGFSKAKGDKAQNFVQFRSDKDKSTSICYWRRSDFSADEEDSQRINDVLKKPPHVLSEDETLDLMPLMKPGRPWGNGNHKDLSLSTEDIDGRRVLVADFKFNDSDKRVHMIIANQDGDKHQVENIWVEGSASSFDKNNKAAIDALKQIKWANKPEK